MIWNLRRTAAHSFVILASGFLILTGNVLAQEPTPAGDLTQSIENAKSGFKPVTSEDVAAAKSTLQAKLNSLQRLLSNGSSENEKAWKDYLRWDDLQAQLSAEKPDMRTLEEIYLKFKGSYAGLDKRQVIEARQALRTYINLAYFSQVDKYKQLFDMQIKSLADAVKRYSNMATGDDARAIGAILGWLEQGNQVPSSVKTIRNKLDQPNLYASVSRELIAGGIRRPVDQVNPVHEIILGTNVRGTAHMVGDVDVNLVPSKTKGLIELSLTGTVSSDNVGVNGPATIYSTGFSTIGASKLLSVDKDGLTANPSVANADTSTTFNAICAKMKLVQKIATKRAYQQKSQAEAIASDRTEFRIQNRFDNETKDLVADANNRLKEKLYRPLIGRDEFPDAINVSTTTDHLNLEVMQASQSQLAAPGPAPATEDKEADLTLKLHESIVNNYGETFLAGVKLTDEKLVELLKERGAEIPEELQITPDTDPWSITFDYKSPIQVVFDNDTVKIGIRGRQFTRGDNEVNRTIAISADYKIEKGESGTLLTRTGDVVVDFPTQERLGPLDLTAKTFLRKKFEAVFKQEIVGEGIKLEGQWEKAGTLRISSLAVTPGWFVGSWRLEAPTPTAATEVTSVVD
ncbi:hypothetical protein C5Y96_00390 [Blastopirellula marina]|uniref:Uncharacterized protein n=1 Tax=Blastopirellula marina TaxID=124 RepID=A0A2S8GBN2_9BACT|nr:MULTISPECIES: hypothetical protein [Pirellulaceae]PQO41865.1 hypothetical protein C5Y96_00390 [Blastopirellula marina]RCS56417.1 hypothetical protein DTL36_00390 [Bremerella cremea]